MGVLLACEKIEKFLALRLCQRVMALRKCLVDHSFPDHVIRVRKEPGPPPRSMGLSRLLKTRFLSLTLRHRNAVTWTCDQHTWFSFIYIDFTSPFSNYTPELGVF
jgi:hypothetical protein